MKDIKSFGEDPLDEVKDTSADEVKPETRAPEKKDPKIVAIEPQAMQIPMFRINGLTPELEKEALKKLSNGVPRDEILEFYGISASDISVICQK